MSTLTPPPPSPPESEDRHDAKALEALIEEARRRARRRRRGYAALALVAVAAGLLGFSVLDSDGGGAGPAEGEGGVAAQVTDGRWRPATGLEGGTITALAVDPRHPDTVFAATVRAGVFKSADGAHTWRSLNLPSRLGRPDAIAIAPRDPETLYVGTGRGVAKTTDGGRSWRMTGSKLRGRQMGGELYWRNQWCCEERGFVYTLVVDPRDPDIVYAGTWNRGVLKSTDGGASWRRTGLGAVSQLLFDPRHPSTLYAAAVGAVTGNGDGFERVSDGAGRDRGGVFKSSDQGESWDPVGLQGTTVHALALDPEHPGTMYAGTDTRGILKTTDGGASWSDAGLKGQTITGLTLDPSNTDILYATTPSWGAGVLKNEDGGRSRRWRSINAGTSPEWTGHEFSTPLALDPRNPATIYVATKGDLSTEGRGVSKSLDGGRSWRSTNAGLNGARVSALALAPGSPGTAYATVERRGLFKRADGRWRAVEIGMTSPGNGIAVDPHDPATVYAGAVDGIYKSTNAGANWRASFTLPLRDDRVDSGPELVVDPQHPATVYAITATHNDRSIFESHVYRSQDGGRTWPMLSQVQAVTVPAAPGVSIDRWPTAPPLAIDPVNPDTLYAGGLGVHTSVDAGKTWRKAGLPRSPVLALAVDPKDTAVLYAGTDAGLSKSTNAGTTWQPLRGALDDVRVEALAIDPLYRRTVIAGTDRGVFWSTDGGDRWRRFTHLPPRTFDALAVDRSAGLLYAGAYGGGIYELELAR